MYRKSMEIKGIDISRNFEALDEAVRKEYGTGLTETFGYEDQEDLDNAGFWIEFTDNATVIWEEVC